LPVSDKAFRHGDIENVLETLVKNAGRSAGGGGLLGFAQNVLQSAAGGAKFSKSDIKKVYFVSLNFIFMMQALIYDWYAGKLVKRLLPGL
jgi:hypothetical protein